MKGDKANCPRCNKEFLKKRIDHKYCGGTCRTLHNRTLKGESEIPFPKYQKKTKSKDMNKMTMQEFTLWWLKDKPIDAENLKLIADFSNEYTTVNKLMEEGKLAIPKSDYKI